MHQIKMKRLFIAIIIGSFLLAFGCDKVGEKEQCRHERSETFERSGFIDRQNTFYLANTGTIADKYCSTDMVMQYRWEDPVLARSDWQPPAILNFQAGFSYFTPQIVRKGNVTNGYYWEAWVTTDDSFDQIKNPVAFMVIADYFYYPNRPQGKVLITTQIEYKEYNPLKY